MITAKNNNDNSVLQYKKISYEEELNGHGKFEIILDGQTNARKSSFSEGDEISIYRNGSLDFIGSIESFIYNETGGFIILGKGIEIEMLDEKCPTDVGSDRKIYTSTNDNTIFQDLVNASTSWSANIASSTQVNVASFRTNQEMSIWNAIGRLIQTTGKDIQLNRSTKTIYIKDRTPVSPRTNNFNFIEGNEITNIQKNTNRPTNKVIVYGKGDGENKIIGSAGSGVPLKIVHDENVSSVTEADQRAQSVLDLLSSQNVSYTFNLLNINSLVVIGQGGKLSSPTIESSSVEIDIVRIKRVQDTQSEKISVEVTNPEYRIAKQSDAQLVASMMAMNQSQVGMSGTTNVLTFKDMVNGNDTNPLRLYMNLPEDFIKDEVGNIRVNSFTLDYDIDPYRQGSGVSVTEQSPYTKFTDIDFESSTSTTLSNNSWTTLATVSNSSYLNKDLFFNVVVEGDSGGAEDLRFRVGLHIDGVGIFYQLYIGQADFENASILVLNGLYGGIMVDAADYLELEGTCESAGNMDVDARLDLLIQNTDLHDHDIAIEDAVDDSASVNAGGITWQLHYWNTGTTNWDLKDTGSDTFPGGSTLNTNIDISDGGTYPDAAGSWRLSIFTDESDPDLIKGIVSVKHELDT